MKDHTPEPWATAYREDCEGMFSQEIFDAKGETIASCAWYKVKLDDRTTTTNREANARRIVACVNACAGMIDPEKEIAALKKELVTPIMVQTNRLVDSLADVTAQRDELLAALTHAATDYIDQNGSVPSWWTDKIRQMVKDMPHA